MAWRSAAAQLGPSASARDLGERVGAAQRSAGLVAVAAGHERLDLGGRERRMAGRGRLAQLGGHADGALELGRGLREHLGQLAQRRAAHARDDVRSDGGAAELDEATALERAALGGALDAQIAGDARARAAFTDPRWPASRAP